MAKIYTNIFRGTTNRALGKRVPTSDGRGYTTIPDGIEYGDIIIEFNLPHLVRYLGVKALQNKSGKSGVLGGLIRARVTKRYRKQEAE